MKKLLLILLILSSFYVKGDIHQIQVWNGYYQFLPSNNITVQLGDTVQWVQLDPPTMTHTITSDNIPNGAIPFDQIWQLPADTFFQYIPQVVGLYQYVCTPHIPFGMIGEFTVVNGPQTYVPDDNFEAYLEANGMGNGISNDDYVTTASIDTVTYLYVDGQNISDLTGIEYFTALEVLWCGMNPLTTLDVSNNTALYFLRTRYNQLTTLDVSGATSLTTLDCNDNNLTNLDVSSNLLLEDLSCDWNQLTSLDLSTNTLLNVLECNLNQLTTLDVSTNTLLDVLYCSDNQLTTLNVSTNTLLEELACWSNNLTSLDIGGATSLTDLYCFNNNLTNLDVSTNVLLEELGCGNNQLTNLDIRNGNNSNLDLLDCTNNPNLICINVDDVAWSTVNWTVANGNIDTQHYFSNNCNPSAIKEQTTNKELLKVTDLLGRETKQTNQPLFYIYDDGTVEKRIVIE